MTEHSYTVEVQPDFLERQSKAKPVQAVAELIWNDLDADASRVDVRLEYRRTWNDKNNSPGQRTWHPLPGCTAVIHASWGFLEEIRADGTKTKERMLHGYEGRGRFKVFALGRVADWRVTYRSDTGDLRGYDITMLEDNIREVRITDEHSVETGVTGVESRSIGVTPGIQIA